MMKLNTKYANLYKRKYNGVLGVQFHHRSLAHQVRQSIQTKVQWCSDVIQIMQRPLTPNLTPPEYEVISLFNQ